MYSLVFRPMVYDFQIIRTPTASEHILTYTTATTWTTKAITNQTTTATALTKQHITKGVFIR